MPSTRSRTHGTRHTVNDLQVHIIRPGKIICVCPALIVIVCEGHDVLLDLRAKEESVVFCTYDSVIVVIRQTPLQDQSPDPLKAEQVLYRKLQNDRRPRTNRPQISDTQAGSALQDV